MLLGHLNLKTVLRWRLADWYCVVVWGPGVLLQGTFNPKSPRGSQSQRAKVSLDQQIVERAVDLETRRGPLGTWMIREIEKFHLPVSP